ncbi:unnamed protein product, partial [Prorocentrum cordatum]
SSSPLVPGSLHEAWRAPGGSEVARKAGGTSGQDRLWQPPMRASARRVRQALRSLRRRGFVNYVGMQRFGKAGVRSDLLGLAYLRGEYERCVDLLLHQGAGGCRNEAGAGGREFKWVETFRRTGSAAATLRTISPEGLQVQLSSRFAQTSGVACSDFGPGGSVGRGQKCKLAAKCSPPFLSRCPFRFPFPGREEMVREQKGGNIVRSISRPLAMPHFGLWTERRLLTALHRRREDDGGLDGWKNSC